jgi:hypothetical protein
MYQRTTKLSVRQLVLILAVILVAPLIGLATSSCTAPTYVPMPDASTSPTAPLTVATSTPEQHYGIPSPTLRSSTPSGSDEATSPSVTQEPTYFILPVSETPTLPVSHTLTPTLTPTATDIISPTATLTPTMPLPAPTTLVAEKTVWSGTPPSGNSDPLLPTTGAPLELPRDWLLAGFVLMFGGIGMWLLGYLEFNPVRSLLTTFHLRVALTYISRLHRLRRRVRAWRYKEPRSR